VAYSDTTSGNASNTYRSDDVDVASCGSGCFFIGTAAAGEYTEYTVNVTSAGARTLQVRVAATSTRTIHLEMDGTTIATFSIPSTGSYSTYTTLSTNVTLTAGQKVMKLVFDSGSANVDWISFQ
jgi:hypothetical protein